MQRFLPAIAAALTACVLAAFAAISVDGLWRPDAFDYAQIAREIFEGNGFTTRQAIYVLHLEFLAEHGLLDAPWPTLHRFPLPPLAIAAGFALLGVGLPAVVAYGIFFHALTAGLVFAWGRELAGLPVACASTLLVAANAAMLETAPSGLSEPPAIFFFTLALHALWRGHANGGAGRAVLCGAALGLAALARTNALFVAPVFAVALLARRRPVELVGWLVGLLVALAPWWIRNLLVAGSPFYSLHGYFLLPAGTEPDGWKWDVTQPWVRHAVSPIRFALDHPGPVLAKWARNLSGLLHDAPTFAGTLGLVPIALAALLPIAPSRRLRSPAVVLFGCIVTNAVLVSFTDIYFDKYHYLFLPALVLLATALVWNALSLLGDVRARALAFSVCVAALANPPAVLGVRDTIRARTARFDADQLAYVLAHTEPDDLILSDFSYAVTWATNRRTIRTHFDRLDDGTTILAASWIAEHYLPIDAIYLSREFTAGPGRSRTLRDTLERDPGFRERFPVVHRFEDGALFFARSRAASP